MLFMPEEKCIKISFPTVISHTKYRAWYEFYKIFKKRRGKQKKRPPLNRQHTQFYH